MSLTPDEQKLYDFAKGALPAWMKRDDEFLAAAAKTLGAVLLQVKYLFKQTLITTADGPTSTTPDWLGQHARDRGTSRQAGETSPVLAERLRVVPDTLTRTAILDAANAILTAAGIAGVAALVELPRDGAWLGNYTAMSGTGGTFQQSGTVQGFIPTVLPWPIPPWQDATVTPVLQHRLVITGAATGANNGTRAITGLQDNAALVTNASGVAGADPTVAWKVERLDALGNLTDGFARAYCGRGWRICTPRPSKLIVILPFGTSAAVAASVEESIRTKKAAGIRLLVERRVNP